jgi:acyl dehydratase
MPLNLALPLSMVGQTSAPLPFSYGWKDVVLYALSVGARADELDYLYEGRGPRVLPTFAVVPSFTSMLDVLRRLDAPLKDVLHGEQRIRLRAPIPPTGTLQTRSTITEIYDKGKGALVAVECTTSTEDGAPLFDNRFNLFVRGAGGFGGERGPEAEKLEPPAGKAPDFEVVETTSAEQALVYRLNGDFNPLHADPAFAKRAGFERPILHGLCSYGVACKAAVDAALDGDPTRVARYAARFAGVAFPGETYRVSWWREDARVLLEARSVERDAPIITNAALDLRG